MIFKEPFTSLRESLDAFEGLIEEEVRVSTQRCRQVRADAERALLLTLLVAGGDPSCSAGWFVFKTISTPLTHLTSITRRLATGDLQQQVDSTLFTSPDEMGALGTALRELSQYLRGLALAVERIDRNELSVQIRPRSRHDMFSRLVMYLLKILYNEQSTLEPGSESLTDSLIRDGQACDTTLNEFG